MTATNKRNLVYFESPTMRGLYETMDAWQQEHELRLLSISIQQDNGTFCCIALTNPAEVVITSADGHHHASVNRFGLLAVDSQ
ncbi:hypothetical protein OHB26_34670 [Nocardia sp. NBC_01503]|uniref:hypothetical protein n=1 Tax=Nocardia sp. NBC_01503 TaxID=2975997 RepID=UPI002E7C09BE|nr:hypothetical protein [Nocardia sp. NBC_01503]WTL31989.1 hypothetical protein OHB26_34670 [Nocardia sp. NBC_01503]